MQRWLGVGAVVGLFGAMAGACSSTTPVPYPDQMSFCQAKAKAECQVAALCASDTSTCTAARFAACQTYAASATQNGTRSYNSGNAKSCVDAVNAAFNPNGNTVLGVKASDLDPTTSGSMADKCARVFTGSASLNASCTSTYDCSSGICSLVNPAVQSNSKVCATEQDVQPQGQCANAGSVCKGDSYCAQNPAGEALCLSEPTSIGQSCSAAIPCAHSQSLRCVGNVCQPQATAGEACATNEDCGTSAPYCDTYAGNICTTGLAFAGGSFDCTGFVRGVTVDAGVQDTGAPDTGADTGAPDTGAGDGAADSAAD